MAGASPAVDRHLRQRAALLAELEVARWLLHGTETRSTEIVDDAVQMLSDLVDETQKDLMNPIGGPTGPGCCPVGSDLGSNSGTLMC